MFRLFFIFIIGAFSVPLLAEVLEKIEVRDQNPSAMPLTATTSEEKDLPRLLTLEPNLNSASGANHTRFFQIRGRGETSQFEHSQVNSVGLFYEGIDFSEEASSLPALGLESGEIRYGPQSVDWGSKALAGLLDFRSCLESPCGRAEASLGNFNSRSLRGGGQVDPGGFSILLGAGLDRSDGFYYNEHLRKFTSQRDETSALLGLSYRLGRIQFREHHIFALLKNGYDQWNFTPSFNTQSDRPGKDFAQTDGHSLRARLPLDSGRSIHSLTSMTFTRQEESYDEDWSYDPSNDYFASFERRRRKWHQKLSFESPSSSLGLHYYTYEERQLNRSFKSGMLRRQEEPNFVSRSLALFGKTQWREFFGGLRLEQQWAKFDGVGLSAQSTPHPQLAAELGWVRPWRTKTLRALYSRGYRGAGFNTNPAVGIDLLGFDPEALNNLELGLDSPDAGQSLRHRVFYQWQEDQQARTSAQLDPTDPNSFSYYTSNEGSSRGFGYELRARQIWRSLTFSENLGLLWTRQNHRAMAQAAPWNYMLRVDYVRGPWTWYSQLAGRAGYYHSLEHDYKSKSYHLTDLGVSRAFGKLEIKLAARNIFDRRYVVRAYHFANEPPDWIEKDYEEFGAPRTIALQAVYTF